VLQPSIVLRVEAVFNKNTTPQYRKNHLVEACARFRPTAIDKFFTRSKINFLPLSCVCLSLSYVKNVFKPKESELNYKIEKGEAKMQNQNEIAKINHFLSLVLPIVIELLRTILRATGCEVKEEGTGPDLVFSIKSGQKHVEFYLQNLLLEIATVDRDEEPLRFDERLQDFDFFIAKTAHVVQSKLAVLFHLLGQEDVDAAIENISQNAKQYERIRIWRLDQKPT